MVGILLLAGAVGGCDGGGHDDGFPERGVCLVFREVEPNATPLPRNCLTMCLWRLCRGRGESL